MQSHKNKVQVEQIDTEGQLTLPTEKHHNILLYSHMKWKSITLRTVEAWVAFWHAQRHTCAAPGPPDVQANYEL